MEAKIKRQKELPGMKERTEVIKASMEATFERAYRELYRLLDVLAEVLGRMVNSYKGLSATYDNYIAWASSRETTWGMEIG
jgi:hypothetical protein